MFERGYYKVVKSFNYASTYPSGDVYVVTFQVGSVVKPHPTFENVYKVYDDAYMWANDPENGKREYVKGALTADIGIDFVHDSGFFEEITEAEANGIFDENEWKKGLVEDGSK